MTPFRHHRSASVLAWAGVGALAAALLWATPAAAQVGAFSGAPPSVDASGPQGIVRAPIVTEGAVFAGAGQWTGTLQVGITTGSIDFPGGSVDYDVTQTALGVSYAPSDRLLVGAAFLPWNRVSLSGGGESLSESGRGDASLEARFRAWSADDGRTDLAVVGGMSLPVGAEGFGAEGVIGSVGTAVSRHLDGASVHGSARLILPFDDSDGDSVVRLTGAAVYGVGDRTAVSGELMANFSGGEYIVDLAPGIRFQPAPGVFLDAAVLVNLATSFESIYDAGFVLALRLGGG